MLNATTPQINLLLLLLLLMQALVNLATSQPFADRRFQNHQIEQQLQPQQHPHSQQLPLGSADYDGARQKRGGGRLSVQDAKTGRLLHLMPGFLDHALLNRGSFSFQAKQVDFDKLKVLGNVYVNRVNGKPLREQYLFKRNRADHDEAHASSN